MGNSQSASSTRKDSNIPEVEINEESAVSAPGAIAPSQSTETPAENEEGDASRRVIAKRRSLLKFPLLRRKSRSVVGLNDETPDDATLDSPSPSRRRWRAFSGLKSRPISTIADSSATATEEQPPQYGPTIADTEQGVSSKGKERETEATPQESAQAQESADRSIEPIADMSGPSLPTVVDHETAPSPAMVLRELREMQDTLATGNDAQSHDLVPTQVENDVRHQSERPPTPIPSSVLDATHELRESNRPSGNNTALTEALGSWMSGRGRNETTESVSNEAPVTSNSPPLGTESSTPQRPHSNIPLGINNSSDSLGPFARYHSQPANTPGMSTSEALPIPLVPSNVLGQNQDRRTLPPAGTGTLVVVQGVVHTTDVRHAQSPVPSTSQTTPDALRSPRPTSSTPTLRASSRPSASATPTRASTPQPPLRRGRFSSLTNSLRPRSRPRTPSLRGAGMAGWRHSFADPGYEHSTSEAASEHSESLAQGIGSSTSDSEAASTFISSAARASAQSSASLAESSRSGGQNIQDNVQISHGSQPLTDREGGSGNVDTRGQAREGDTDGASEDEGEAELSASSIEVLGTLLSVATAATAASLVTGTTDPLFSSGLAGPLANATTRNPLSSPRDGMNTGVPSYFPSPPRSPTSQGVDADSNNPEAAVNTRMRSAWESLRDRFSRTRGRRSTSTAEGEGREDSREQMLREMARAFNMGLGLDPESNHERWEQERRNSGRQPEGGEGVAHAGVSVSDPPPSSDEAERSPRIAPESRGPGPGPEGSFERFLHNLQVDLRTALTEDYAVRRARAQQARDARTASQSASMTDGERVSTSPADSAVPVSPSETQTNHNSERHENEASSAMHVTEADPPSPSLIPTVPNTPRAATFDLPPLPGASETRTQVGSDFVPAPAQAQGITGQPGAGINWWRLYRFPPMQLAPHPASGNTDTSTAAGVPAQPQPVPSQHPAEPPSAEPHTPLVDNSSHSPDSPPLPSSPQASPNHVVPVIVVGLQSVPVNRAHQHPHRHDSPSPFGPPSTNGSAPSAGVPSNMPTRDRAWPLRAASRAFGRRGRQNDMEPSIDSSTPPENEGHGLTRESRQGGRTYLIFVIGGYYPPNHSIVTGADDMNSFEALWELAELLGQVKPPVASKEDIEKSGLEVIKASSLLDYEKCGKVASNTVERVKCLICLDDYDPQDDLRLLTCRHIFHKQCVDKWLEQGRNNCPACRTKGVSTGDGPPTQPAPDMQSDSLLGDLD